MQFQLVVTDCLTQVVLQYQLRNGTGIDVFGIKLVSAFALGFGVIHGDFGVAQQIFRVPGVGGEHGNADTGRDTHFVVVYNKRIFYGSENAFRR